MARTLDDVSPPTVGGSRRKPASGRVEAAYLAATLLVTALAATVLLKIWQADPRVPFVYRFDGYFDGFVIKGILDHGWYLDNPSVGAPFALRLHDFPLGGENLQFLLMKGLGLFSRDWALVMNAYVLLSFALIAVAAYVVARQARVARGLSLVLATLFSFLPYRFAVGELLQSAYFAVPLGAFLVLDAFGWDVWGPPFLGRTGSDRSGHPRARWAVRAVLAAVVASAGSYHAPFTMVLVAVAVALRLLASRERRPLLRVGGVIALLGAVMVLNVAPTLLYRSRHGVNDQVSVRQRGESDTYALHIVDLFLPALDHRIPAFARVTKELNGWWPTSPIFPAPHQPLGVVAAAGLALSVGTLLARALRPERPPGPRAGGQLAGLGGLNLAAILFGAATGFSSLLALAGLTQVRVWSRISIFIAFFSLVAVALAAQHSWRRLASFLAARGTGRPRIRAVGFAAGAGALVLGLLDQTQARIVPPYAVNRAVFTADRRFVGEIERRLPPGSAVFQLPLASFPERPPIVNLLDYQLLRGYLHSKALRWSYPAMRGRPADWAWSMGGRSVEDMLTAVTAAGFSGLYVDRAGFVDRAAGLERETTRLVGPPAVVSADGFLVFWDLRSWAERRLAVLGREALGARQALVLHPVVPSWGTGFHKPDADPPYAAFGGFLFYPEVPGQRFVTGRYAQSPATLELTNPRPAPRPVRLRMRVSSASGEAGSLTFSAPGQADVPVRVTPEPAVVEVPLVLAPGTSTIGVTSSLPATMTPSGGSAAFRIENVIVADVDRPTGDLAR